MQRWAVLDKLKFWKHDSDADFSSLPDDPMQQNPDPLAQTSAPDPYASDPLQRQDPFDDPPGQSFQQPPGQQSYPGGTMGHVRQPPPEPDSSGSDALQNMGRGFGQYDHVPEQTEHTGRDSDMEIVISKLRALEHMVENVSDRLKRMEQRTEQREKRYW